MARPFRIHMYGKGLFYSGHSALCWKWPRAVDTEKAGLSLDWPEVNCPRCLALKPSPERIAAAANQYAATDDGGKA